MTNYYDLFSGFNQRISESFNLDMKAWNKYTKWWAESLGIFYNLLRDEILQNESFLKLKLCINFYYGDVFEGSWKYAKSLKFNVSYLSSSSKIVFTILGNRHFKPWTMPFPLPLIYLNWYVCFCSVVRFAVHFGH